MVTTIEYALMAGRAYLTTRREINQFPIPQGWAEIFHVPDPDNPVFPVTDGFEAVSFRRGNNPTEIVISFAGTDPSDLTGDVAADIALAEGFGSSQLLQAADYYLAVKAANRDANITFTGHSLGGGLAALMGVFFGRQAVTFDQAPFAASAEWQLLRPNVAANLRQHLLDKALTDPDQVAARNEIVSSLSNFLAMRDVNGGIPNSSLVSTIRVDGEFLGAAPYMRIGLLGEPSLTHGDYFGPLDLHSQTLLAAFLQSNLSAANAGVRQQTLSEVTKKLTDLLAMIFDKALFANPITTDSDKRNFLEHIVRHEAGVQGSFIADAMVTRFTQDLWKLAQDGGLTLSDGNVWNPALNNLSKALTAFAMQKYYDETQASAGYNKTLFSDVSGGIQFDRADVVATLGAAKGDKYFQAYLLTNFTPAERNLINSLLPLLRDWYIQAGTSALNAADTQNRNAFLLGGSGSDGLVGGSGADLLVGNAGADMLQGKGGNDILLGGSGDDTYVYTTGDGLDTLLDTAGQNTLAVDGDLLVGGAQFGDARVHRSADGKHLYVETGGRMLIDGNLVIQNYATGGSFGLAMTGPLAEAGLVTLTGNAADNFIGSDIYYRNPTDGSVYQATLVDGTTKLSDLTGGGASNSLEGKAGSDILSGGAGDDRLYADSQISAADAIVQGNAQTGSGLKGDWLAAGGGNDTLVGGAGDDDILGDGDWVATTFDWSVTDQGGQRVFDPVQGTLTPADGAADVIYAGAGLDYVWAGTGNDVVFGEAGADRLNGNEGNDILLGDAGTDTLWGGIDHDYLDGGAEADGLEGGDGDDILIGGKGNDTIHGGAGRDTYIFNKGDGIDTIQDDDTGPEKSILVFGEGVDPNSIKLRPGSLLLDLGNGDAIHIENFDQENPLATQSFASFQFADGTSLSWEELLQRGFDIDGTEGADTLIGTGVEDRLDGKAGDDLIYGLAGNDTLTGGTGTDGLSGGAGDDTYLLNVGDGSLSVEGLTETIVDRIGINTVQFGAGITVDAIGTELDPTGRYLFVTYGTDDKIAVEDGAVGNVAAYRFADGQRLGFAELIGRTAGTVLSGTSLGGSYFALGGTANDVIESGTGGALVSGGRGNDTISGWGGGNTYLYSRGDGADVLYDSGQALDANGHPVPNRIRFGADIALADLVFARRADGALHIGFADSLEGITLPGWYLSGDRVTPSIQELVFADGTVFATAALNGLAVGPIEGTAGDDAIRRLPITRESRRWRHGDQGSRAVNVTEWRAAA